ncbi:MAG TPA: hypothetical protein PLN42_06645 [Anaerolineae bacterium]|nr:hypothetical protein [Anaerolineae bacterium]
MTLYYISLFNYSRNQYARFMISAHTEEVARAKAFDIVGVNYRLSAITAVCHTADNVFIEL